MNGPRLIRIATLLLLSIFATSSAQVLGVEDVIEASARCSLYDAIAAANTDKGAGGCTAGRDADTIRLTADVTLDRELPRIVSRINIEGEGYTISGVDQFRIFEIDRAGSLAIRDIVLTGGFAKRGGAILNEGILRVDSSQFNNNTSERGGSAIYNADGELTVESSTFTENLSKFVSYDGGAIANRGDATISRSLFTQNESPKGSAINNHGDMWISQSTLAANIGEYGGTIDNRGWLTIERSSINDNRSEQSAGILSQGPTSRLVINNSTISGNQAGPWGGGGITAYGTAILTHVTIADNVADEIGGIYRRESMGGLVILRNSIVAGNSGGDCAVGLHENTNSIIGDGSCDSPISGDPLFDPAADRYLPRAGSPALGAADPRYCPPVDQFGNERPSDEPCDIGAVESRFPYSSPASRQAPRSAPTKCTLGDQIIAFNTDAPYGACPAGDGADNIALDNVYVSTDALPYRITSDITIEGRGRSIGDRYSRSQLFEVLGGRLTLRNVTLFGGYSPWTGGAIAVLKGRLTLHNVTIRDSTAVVGGAIFNDGGDVAIVGGRFVNNRAEDLGGWQTGLGGAVYSSGSLRIDNSSFSANTASYGGAVDAEGDDTTVEIIRSSFSSNKASFGGAVSNSGQLDIDQSVFLDNAANGDYYSPGGGGAISSSGDVRIRNSTFSGNNGFYGGAISLSDAKATLQHITVVRNVGGYAGGILSHDYSGQGGINLSNSLIAGNTGFNECEIKPPENLKNSSGNLIEDGSCNADIQGDPQLSPYSAMANAIALQAGSPALDAGDPDFCLPIDQIGNPRSRGAGCDIGALEVLPDQP